VVFVDEDGALSPLGHPVTMRSQFHGRTHLYCHPVPPGYQFIPRQSMLPGVTILIRIDYGYIAVDGPGEFLGDSSIWWLIHGPGELRLDHFLPRKPTDPSELEDPISEHPLTHRSEP